MLIVKRMSEIKSCAGDFNEVVDLKKGTLYLPVDVLDRLKAGQTNAIEDRPFPSFLGICQTFPTGVADILGWTVEDVQNATRNMAENLEKAGLIPAGSANPVTRPPRATGARRPHQP